MKKVLLFVLAAVAIGLPIFAMQFKPEATKVEQEVELLKNEHEENANIQAEQKDQNEGKAEVEHKVEDSASTPPEQKAREKSTEQHEEAQPSPAATGEEAKQ